MSEQNMNENGEKRYARIKVPAEQVFLTSKVFETAKGTEMRGAFIHLPKGTELDGRDLTGYRVARAPRGLPGPPRGRRPGRRAPLRPEPPGLRLQGLRRGRTKDEDQGERLRPVHRHQERLQGPQENREKYCKISVPRSNVRPFERLDEATGEVVEEGRGQAARGHERQRPGPRRAHRLPVHEQVQREGHGQPARLHPLLHPQGRRCERVADKGTDIADVRVSARRCPAPWRAPSRWPAARRPTPRRAIIRASPSSRASRAWARR